MSKKNKHKSKIKTTLHYLIFFCLALWHLYCFIPVLAHFPLQIGQIKIHDRHGKLITHLAKKNGFQVVIKKEEAIPEKLKTVLLRSEDKRFYTHWGIDVLAKARALRSNLRARRIVSGGSTLTEQWIKNKYFQASSRSLVQKLREATLSFYYSLSLDKEEVLRRYLNQAYFGKQIYGLKSAAYVYFEKSNLDSLSDQEIITLISIIKSPHTITSNEEYFQKVFNKISEKKVPLPQIGFKKFTSLNLFPHVSNSILEDLESLLKEEAEIFVESTIDAKMQKKAQEIVSNSLLRLQGKRVSNAAVYVFNPQNGDILVYLGSKDFFDSEIDGQVNIIKQKRQVGSSIKPFIYLFAFMNGAHPDHLIVDLEKDFSGKDKNIIFRPLNYSLHEEGVVTLKEALANSLNVSAVRILEHLKLEKTFDFLKKLGLQFDFNPEHYGLSLALGTPDLSLKNLASAYGILASSGQKVETSLINKINGKIKKRKKQQVLKKTSNNQEALYHLYEVLSSSIFRRKSFGLNSILNTSVPFAVKTGTTRNFKDNWTLGYHPNLVVASWVGNNDSSPMTNVTGVSGAAPIWHRVVEEAIQEGYVKSNFIRPKSLQVTSKCLDSNCSQKELIYQSQNKEWLSNLRDGKYCLEDFYIQDIDSSEVQKVAKLFQFKDFSISWCNSQLSSLIPHPREATILKPKNKEVFYIKKDVPLELQKIIIKANEKVDWIIDNEEYRETSTIFLLPKVGKHEARIKGEDMKVDFEVKFIE